MLRLVVALFLVLSAPARADMQLVMVEEHGCVWCIRWNEEIGPIYPKTDLGQQAPLIRVDIGSADATPFEFHARLNFTPTFVLMQDGAEIGRLEGYPGEDFFWPIMEQMLAKAQAEDLG